MKLADLKLNPDNPRNISEDKLDKLAQSIKDFPKMMKLRPIVHQDGVVIGGNMRYRAIQKLGMDEIPDDWVADANDLTDAERHRFIMQDNASMGEHDWDMVANQYELEDLDAWGIDVPYADVAEEVEEDEAPEVSSEPPVSQLGSIYQLGRHFVMCGDSTDKANVELLMNGTKADMVFTDPPYGMDLDTDYSKLPSTKAEGNKKYSRVIGDDKEYDPIHVLEQFDYCNEIIMFGADYYADKLPKSGSWYVWDKRVEENFDKMIGAGFELAWSKTKHKREIARFNNTLFSGESEARDKVHPTQKPTKMIGWFFERIKGNTVVDLFLGSGSTLIACEQTDRTCCGMELDPKYVDVIRKRYAKFIDPDNWETKWEELTPIAEQKR